VVPQEQRRVLRNRPRCASSRIQPARRTARNLSGVPLRLESDRERSLLDAEGPGRKTPQ